MAALDVNVTLPPWQKVVLPPVEIAGIEGPGFTVTTTGEDVAVQPAAFVTVTE